LTESKKTLTSLDVKDGDELHWQVNDGQKLLTIKMVSRRDSRVRTAMIVKSTKVGHLCQYLRSALSATPKSLPMPHQLKKWHFRCNGKKFTNRTARKFCGATAAKELKLKDGDTVSWSIETKQKGYDGECPILGYIAITPKESSNASKGLELPFSEKTTVRQLALGIKCALKIITDSAIDIFGENGEELKKKSKKKILSLAAQNVKNGDALSFSFRDGEAEDEKTQMTVDVVCAANLKVTVTVAKNAKVRNLKQFVRTLLAGEGKEDKEGTFAFECNGCVAEVTEKRGSKGAQLREALKLKEGDTIVVRGYQLKETRYGRKRPRETAEDTKTVGRPKKKHRAE